MFHPTADFETRAAPLLERILAQYRLDPNGIHGEGHWRRVRLFGETLAMHTGADVEVVQWFSLFHDARRFTEGEDPEHGARGGLLARRFRDQGLLELDDDRLNMLCRACERHTAGTPHDGEAITIFTCWDADRLDLGRVGVTPLAKHLCTEPARDPDRIAWAMDQWRGKP